MIEDSSRRFQICCLTRFEYDTGHYFITPDLVRNCRHGCRGNPVVKYQRGLYLERGNVLTASPNYVFTSINKVIKPVFILLYDIAGMQPAAFPGLLRLFVVTVVTGKEPPPRFAR